MKYLIVVLLTLFSMVSFADDQPTCKPGRDCEIVKVLTRCDVDKQKLRDEIYALKKRNQKLEEENAKLMNSTTTATLENNTIVIEKKEIVEREVIKHNILALYAAPDISNVSTSQNATTATATAQTSYEPGLKYQYEFGFGLVPELGINVKGSLLFGLGYEF